MLNDLLTNGALTPGVYQLQTELEIDSLVLDTAVSSAGWHGVVLTGRGIIDKAGLLTAVGKQFNFPSYFGQNWDALDEMLCDLSWLPAAGYVVILEEFEGLALADGETWRTFVEIWQDATAVWWAQGVPMFVLVRGRAGDSLPPLLLA
ncbi:MAG: barstar family protein [Anaerolineales bacterium]|nr:barstar family protein [Anaerolineales bacterium]